LTRFPHHSGDNLKTHYIQTTTTGCFKAGTPSRSTCTSKFHISDGLLVLEGTGSCGSWTAAINGTSTINSGTKVTTTFSGNTLDIVLASPNGLVFHESIALSADKTQCSAPVPGCGSGWQTSVGSLGSQRIAGAALRSAGPGSNPQSPARQASEPPKSDSCSDVTGTGGGPSSHCNVPTPTEATVAMHIPIVAHTIGSRRADFFGCVAFFWAGLRIVRIYRLNERCDNQFREVRNQR
jgi:hypothetical protein